MKTIYTIGYTGFTLNSFITTLKNYGISCVVDVRSNPMSKYYPDFNKNNLEQALKLAGIYYRNYVDEFGARQTNKRFYSINGYLDFKKFSKSEFFKSGVDKLITSMNKGYVFALMCAEKDPIDCHRNIMVASEFYRMGYEVKNILADGNYVFQSAIEKRLLEMYFPDRDQFSMFEKCIDNIELVERAYEKRNADIGYKVEEEQ